MVNDELERMVIEAVVAYLSLLSRYLPGWTELNHKEFSRDSRYPGRNLKARPPDYEAGVANHQEISKL
jgi:hypothetical protein